MAQTKPPQHDPQTATPPDLGTPSPAAVEREFTVKAMTSRQLVTRRFFRHRAALLGLTTFLFIFVLAFSSIGAAGISGWWDTPYAQTGSVTDGGRMTLDVIPSPVDGDGFALGEHPFGQDDVGRDYFSNAMRGAQRSLTISLLVGLLSTAIGVVVGAVAGYFGGLWDTVLMRITDAVLVVPILLTAAVLSRQWGNVGPISLAIMISVVIWYSMARLVRGEFLSLREKEFVEAARALGASSGRIIFRHILPNLLGTIIVSATLTVSTAMILETSLSYLNLGVQPPDTSLGRLISDYQGAFSTRPWLFWWPAFFIVAIALSVNFIGDGLRDAFDPRQNRVRN